jgi:hypothetical protein
MSTVSVGFDILDSRLSVIDSQQGNPGGNMLASHQHFVEALNKTKYLYIGFSVSQIV